MTGIAVTHHPNHIFDLVFSALQQMVCHLHALFHDILINCAVETGFESLFQFCLTQKALLRNFGEAQGVEKVFVDELSRRHKAAAILSGEFSAAVLLFRYFLTKQCQQFQDLSFQLEFL